MDQTNAVPIIDNRSSSPIVQAFNYFASHLQMSTLNDYMTVISNVQFVRIDLGPTDDEQQIFDSLNSLGVRLTTSELLTFLAGITSLRIKIFGNLFLKPTKAQKPIGIPKLRPAA